MMKYPALGQEVREMAAPRRRVFAGSMALRLGRVENRFNAPAQARGGFRLCLPKRLQNGENRPCVDFIDLARAQRRGIGFERHAPLRPMLGVAPFA
jgi:hypothetical protein